MTDADERQSLNTERNLVRKREDRTREAMDKEKAIPQQAKITIAALNKKIYDLEEQATNKLDKELADTTTLRRRARDELKRKDSELKALQQTPSEERGAVGGAVKRNPKRQSGAQHKQDSDAAAPSFFDEFCSMTLEKLYPGHEEKKRSRCEPKEIVRKASTEPPNLSHEDLTTIVEKAVKGILKTESKEPEKRKTVPRSSTPRDNWFREYDDPDDSDKEELKTEGYTQSKNTRMTQAMTKEKIIKAQPGIGERTLPKTGNPRRKIADPSRILQN